MPWNTTASSDRIYAAAISMGFLSTVSSRVQWYMFLELVCWQVDVHAH